MTGARKASAQAIMAAILGMGNPLLLGAVVVPEP